MIQEIFVFLLHCKLPKYYTLTISLATQKFEAYRIKKGALYFDERR